MYKYAKNGPFIRTFTYIIQCISKCILSRVSPAGLGKDFAPLPATLSTIHVFHITKHRSIPIFVLHTIYSFALFLVLFLRVTVSFLLRAKSMVKKSFLSFFCLFNIYYPISGFGSSSPWMNCQTCLCVRTRICRCIHVPYTSEYSCYFWPGHFKDIVNMRQVHRGLFHLTFAL